MGLMPLCSHIESTSNLKLKPIQYPIFQKLADIGFRLSVQLYRQSCLNVGCWNVYSLVEAEGPVTNRINQRGVSVDCKINFLVGELRRFEMSITGISETKWFGQGVYESGWVCNGSLRPTSTWGK